MTFAGYLVGLVVPLPPWLAYLAFVAFAVGVTRSALASETLVAPALARRTVWVVACFVGVGLLILSVTASGQQASHALVGIAPILAPIVSLAAGRPTDWQGWAILLLGGVAALVVVALVVAPVIFFLAMVVAQTASQHPSSIIVLFVSSVFAGIVIGFGCALTIALIVGPGRLRPSRPATT